MQDYIEFCAQQAAERHGFECEVEIIEYLDFKFRWDRKGRHVKVYLPDYLRVIECLEDAHPGAIEDFMNNLFLKIKGESAGYGAFRDAILDDRFAAKTQFAWMMRHGAKGDYSATNYLDLWRDAVNWLTRYGYADDDIYQMYIQWAPLKNGMSGAAALHKCILVSDRLAEDRWENVYTRVRREILYQYFFIKANREVFGTGATVSVSEIEARTEAIIPVSHCKV